jgi:tetratricopeptide (TPR) repeat protein
LAAIALSRAEIDWGDPRAAIGYLSRAAENKPGNSEIHYLSGLAYAKLAGDTVSQDLRASARAALTRAAGLAPEAPEIAYALFRLELMGTDPTEEDMAGAVKAWRYGYDVPIYNRMAALAYAWLGNAADAYQAFNTLVRDERNPESAAWAAAWLDRLKQGVSRRELLLAMRRENSASAAP